MCYFPPSYSSFRRVFFSSVFDVLLVVVDPPKHHTHTHSVCVCFCLHTTGRFSGYFYWCIKKKCVKAQKEISQKTFSWVGGSRHLIFFLFPRGNFFSWFDRRFQCDSLTTDSSPAGFLRWRNKVFLTGSG